jgi:UDP-glucose 4-epimerase
MPNTCLHDCELNSFARRRVLVTGATGFIGARLCEALVSLGAEVHGISRSANLSNGTRGARMWAVDLRDANAVHRVVRELDARFVFHLAGKVTAQQDLGLITDTLGSNLLATVNLLVALTGSKVETLLLASSSEEVGDAGVPSSPYAASKLASAIYAEMFRRLYDLPIIRARIFLAYGPRQEASKVIPHIICSLLANLSPRLSTGTRACDFVFVDDVVRGLLMAARSAPVDGKPIDFGTGRATTLKDLARELAALTGRTVEPVFGAAESRKLETTAMADVEATFRLVGWRPAWSLQHGLMKTIEWFEEHQAGVGSVATRDSTTFKFTM